MQTKRQIYRESLEPLHVSNVLLRIYLRAPRSTDITGEGVVANDGVHFGDEEKTK